MENTTRVIDSAESASYSTEAVAEDMKKLLRHLGYAHGPPGLGTLNIQAIFFTLVIVFCGVLIYDWIAYQYAVNSGNISSYSSYSRKLLTTAADVWDQRNAIGLQSYLDRNG